MLKKLQKLFAILGLVIAGYALIFKNYELMKYIDFPLGVMILTIGLNEIKENQRKSGIVTIILSIFILLNTVIILKKS